MPAIPPCPPLVWGQPNHFGDPPDEYAEWKGKSADYDYNVPPPEVCVWRVRWDRQMQRWRVRWSCMPEEAAYTETADEGMELANVLYAERWEQFWEQHNYDSKHDGPKAGLHGESAQQLVSCLVEGVWSILDLRRRDQLSRGAMVGINTATNKIVLYNWGTKSDDGQELNTRPWKEVLDLAGSNYGNWLSPTGNILLEPSTDSTKWSGQRSGFSPSVRHDVTALLDAGVITLEARVYLGNWARKDGRFVGTASDVVNTPDTATRQSVVLYHGTDTLRLPEIQRVGIKPVDENQRAWKRERHVSPHRHTAIYLTASEHQAQYYATKAVNVDKHAVGMYKNSPSWAQYYSGQFTEWQLMLQKWARERRKIEPVTLKVTIPSAAFGNLRADDDFLARNKEKQPADWESSLHDFGQVAYLGTIPPEWIQPVDLGTDAQVESLVDQLLA